MAAYMNGDAMSDQDIVQRLLDQKASAWEAIKAHVEEAEKRDGGWTAEDTEKHERMQKDYDTVAERANELHKAAQDAAQIDEQRAQYEKVVRSTPTPAPSTEATDEDKLKAFLDGESRSVELGRMPTREERVHTKVTAASGGTTVPRVFVNELYDFLIAASPLRGLARVISTPGGENMDFPTVASHGTAAIVGEGTAIGGTDATFSTMTLGAWKYGKLTQLSAELTSDTGVDLVSWIAMDASRAIAQAQGSDFSTGTGTNEPKGYGTAYSIGVTGATGGTGVPTVANLIDLFYSVTEPYRNSGSCAWILRDASAAYIRKLTAASSAPEQWAPSLQAGSPDRLLGKPVFTDPFAAAYGTPAKSISFGDWSTYLIRDAGSVRLERSDDFAFDKDLVTYKVVLRTDANTIDVNGVKHFAGPST